MSLLRSYPNQFSAAFGSTSTGGGSTGTLLSTGMTDFGFPAALAKVVIDAAGPAYLQLNGNPATTNDMRLTTGDGVIDFYDMGVGLSGISICATSTGMTGRLGAWG